MRSGTRLPPSSPIEAARKKVRAYTARYDDAVKLMRSKDLAAFDLTGEADHRSVRLTRSHDSRERP